MSEAVQSIFAKHWESQLQKAQVARQVRNNMSQTILKDSEKEFLLALTCLNMSKQSKHVLSVFTEFD